MVRANGMDMELSTRGTLVQDGPVWGGRIAIKGSPAV
jgi:hypothetical protein